LILYHGSYLEIKKPDLAHSRENVDFGCGLKGVNWYDSTSGFITKKYARVVEQFAKEKSYLLMKHWHSFITQSFIN